MAKCLLIAGLTALLAPLRVSAAFQESSSNPASAAMGGVLMGARGSAAFFSNPAATAGSGRDVYFTYNQLLLGAAAGKLGQGTAAATAATEFGAVSAGFSDFTAEGLMRERTYAVGAAYAISPKLSLGASAKYLWHGFSASSDPLAAGDPVFSRRSSRGAFSFDLGLQVRAESGLRFGLAVRNVNAPDVGLESLDRAPRELQGGVGYEWTKGWRAGLDLLYTDAAPGSPAARLTPAVGVEKSFEQDRFQLRLGASSQALSAGFGIKFAGRFGLDYAFTLPREMDRELGSHRVGLRMAF
jgi:hypothetical protein